MTLAKRVQPTGFTHEPIAKPRGRMSYAKLCLIRAALAVEQPKTPHMLSKAIGVRVNYEEIAEALRVPKVRRRRIVTC